MSDAHSTPTAPAGKPTKPEKPYPEFPLTAHPAGVWCKKIRGHMHYFGPWEDPEGALQKYLDQKDALHSGRTPKPDPQALTVKDVANAFLNHKQARVDSGELSPRTWAEYKECCDLLVTRLGRQRLVDDLTPADFAALRNEMAKRWGVYRLKKMLIYVRGVFKFAFDSGLVPSPLRFGPQFAGPSQKTVRLHRAKGGPKLFTADEIRRMLGGADVNLRAMVLLGINCGFGNNDCGTLPLSAVDLDAAVIDFPRPKTGITRRCPLWPQTVTALREVLARRPARPRDPAAVPLVFVTQRSRPWAKASRSSPLSQQLRQLLDALGINGHRNFYTLRHTFRTVADGAKDQPAADHIMGHEVAHMSTVYREGIDDARLKAVADHVHAWLYPEIRSDR
jgi:integrase